MALDIITSIDLDLTRPNVIVVHAKQYDSTGRIIRAHLLNSGVPWEVPTGVYPVIRYRKSDRLGGYYDTDENGDYAIAFPVSEDRSYVDLTLALQALTTAGTVFMEVNFYNSAAVRLTSFCWKLDVEPSVLPDSKIVSSEYYNALTEAAARVIAETADVIAQIHADAAAAEEAKTYAQLYTGAPRVASAAAGMTDHSLIYVYTGSESGYTNGNWYYWNGSAWASGGAYNATALTTDKTLTTSNMAADAYEAGQLKAAINAALNALEFDAVIEYGYWRLSDGTKQPSQTNTYARTSSKWNGQGVRSAVELSNGDYQFGLIFFDANGNVNGSTNRDAIPVKYIPDSAAQFVINFTKTSGATMTSTDLSNIHSALKVYGATDTTLQAGNKAADAKATGDKIAGVLASGVFDRGVLEANTDLDTLRTIGLYRVPGTGGVVETLVNYPSSRAGRLLVLSDDNGYFCVQMVITTANNIYTRMLIYAGSNGWTDWSDLPQTKSTGNLYNYSEESSSLVDRDNNVISGTADQLNGFHLIDITGQNGGVLNFEFDYTNSGNLTSTAGPAIVGKDSNGDPVTVTSMSDGTERSLIPLTNFKKYVHRSFAYYFPPETCTIELTKNGSPASTVVFSIRELKIERLPKESLFKYADYYPSNTPVDYIARDAVGHAGYVHDGAILRMTDTPDPIPVDENHMGYNEFIASTWETLLPDGYQEGDPYNAATTKIHNVKVERASSWESTPYGANTDTYTIYRYIFTPQNGYEKTLFLTSGCHGNEAEAYWGLYRLVRMVYFEGYKYPTLRNLKDCRLIIVPSWNPWGFQHYRRYNAFSALNTGSTDVAKNYQAWAWLMADNHQVTVNGTVYDIEDVGEANVIWETLQEFDGAISLWIDFHTDPYAGRSTIHVDIDDPRPYEPPYGCYGFAIENSKAFARLASVMDDYYNILRDEYDFTETWHLQATTPGSSFTGWMGGLGFTAGLVEISTFMGNFPYPSGSSGIMKLAQEYFGNCIAEMLR